MPVILSAETTIDPALSTGFTMDGRAQTIIDGGSPYGSLFQVDTSIDDSLLQQLFPGRLGNGSQFPIFGLARNFLDSPYSNFFDRTYVKHVVGSWSVNRSTSSNIQTASVQLARAPDGFDNELTGDRREYWGSPTTSGQAGDGLRRWIMRVQYRGVTGEGQFRGDILIKCIMDSITHTPINGGSVDSIQFTDLMRQYANVPVTLQLPAGHNLSMEEVIKRLIEQTGMVNGFTDNISYNLENALIRNRHMLKPVDLAEGDWLSLAQSMMDLIGGRLVLDQNSGVGAAFVDVENAPKPIKWLYDERDIVTDVNGSSITLSIEGAPEAYTKISTRGSKQVTADTEGGAETTLIEQRSYSLFRDGKPWTHKGSGDPNFPEEFTVVYNGSDDFTIGGGLGDPGTLISTTITSVTIEKPPKGEAVPTTDTEITFTQSLYNPRNSARYVKQIETDGSETLIGNVSLAYADQDSDSGPVFLLRYAREMLTDYAIKQSFFNDTGELFRTETRAYGMYAPKAAKVRADGGQVAFNAAGQVSINIGSYLAPGASQNNSRLTHQPSEVIGVDPPRFIDSGDGNVLAVSAENCILLEKRVEELESDNGYLTRKTTTDSRWAVQPGGEYVFQDGTTGSGQSEVFTEVGQTVETYSQLDEDQVLKIIKRVNNLASGSNTVDTERYNGSLEAVPVKSGYILREDYDSQSDFDAALAADRFKQQDITFECDSSVLEAIRSRNELSNVFIEWAESQADLSGWCDRMIKLGRAFILNITVPINSVLTEGDYGHVRFRTKTIHVDHDFFILDLAHTGGENQPMLTQLRLLCLTWI